MKNRTLLTAAMISTLLSSAVAGTKLVSLATSSPFMPSGSYSGDPIPPSIKIQSPSEKLHYWIGSDVWLDFTVTVPLTPWYSKSMSPYPDCYAITHGNVNQVSFSVDGKAENSAEKVSEYQGVLSFSVNLGRLSDGWHIIVIYVEGLARYGNLTHDIYLGSQYSFQDSTKTELVVSSTEISFIVDEDRPTTPPDIILLSPTNTTYYYIRDWTHIPYVRLEYIAEDTRLSAGYSFDGDINIIPATNGTNLNIPIESHSLTFYANDTFGNSAIPQKVYYEIQKATEPWPQYETPTSSPAHNLTDPAPTPYNESQLTENEIFTSVAIIALVIAAGVCFLIYLIKRK